MKKLLFIIITLLLFSCKKEKEEEQIAPIPIKKTIQPPEWLHGSWKEEDGNQTFVISDYDFLFNDPDDFSNNMDLNKHYDSLTSEYPLLILNQNDLFDKFELDHAVISDTLHVKPNSLSYTFAKIQTGNVNLIEAIHVSNFGYTFDSLYYPIRYEILGSKIKYIKQ